MKTIVKNTFFILSILCFIIFISMVFEIGATLNTSNSDYMKGALISIIETSFFFFIFLILNNKN